MAAAATSASHVVNCFLSVSKSRSGTYYHVSPRCVCVCVGANLATVERGARLDWTKMCLTHSLRVSLFRDEREE